MDFVVNAIIVAGYSFAGSVKTNVMHVGTSDRNPVTWKFSREVVMNYWKSHPPSRKVAKAKFRMFKNYKAFKTY